MNIFITKEQSDFLRSKSVVSLVVGSQFYQLTTKESDTDILHIYPDFKDNLHSLVKSHHQYQYTENNVDHLFVSLQTFVNNLLNGDSTINFESLYNYNILTSDLKFLYDSRNVFINYNLLRAYLGLARRDLKDYNTSKSIKKVFHAYRCYLTAFGLMSGKDYYDILKEDIVLNLDLKQLKNDNLIINVVELSHKIDSLRKTLNENFDSGKIVRKISEQDYLKLDFEIIKLSRQFISEGGFFPDQYYNCENINY